MPLIVLLFCYRGMTYGLQRAAAPTAQRSLLLATWAGRRQARIIQPPLRRQGRRRREASCSALAASLPPAVTERLHFAVLAACAAAAARLESTTSWGRASSAPLLALVLGVCASGAGLLPAWCAAYDCVWNRLLPMSVALLLLRAELQSVANEGRSILVRTHIVSMPPAKPNLILTIQKIYS